jgi:D-alanyl-D-alanine carboxypeptidase
MTALSPTDIAAVDAIVASVMAAGKQPGVALSITGPRGDYVKGYGVAQTAVPMDPNDHFRIGSCTKLFTATAILIQVDKGTIKLTDTLGQYVTGIPNGDIITVRQLLMHESGIYDYTSNRNLQLRMIFIGWASYSTDSVLALIRGGQPLFAPGTSWGYSNSNYILLGLILEKVTGKTVGSVITDEVIAPLGLIETSFPTTASIPAPLARGYYKMSFITIDVTLMNPNISGAAGAIISTVGDLAKFAADLRDGALLSPATQALRQQMFHTGIDFQSVDLTTTTMDYGLGLMKIGDWFGHNGIIPGYGGIVFYNPNNGAIFTGLQNLSINGQLGIQQIFFQVAKAIYLDSVM